MEKLAQLQATLREIENGTRLESVDSILVRQVLRQPPPPRGAKHKSHHKQHELQFGIGTAITSNTVVDATTPELDNVAGKDAYRVLLQLRKNKKKKQQVDKQSEAPATHNQQEPSPTISTHSPTKADTVRMGLTVQSPILLSSNSELVEQKARISNAFIVPTQSSSVPDFAEPTTDKEMQVAIRARGKELVRSQQQVEIATTELHALIEESQKLLSNQFLFERNLKDFCQERSLQVIQNVLLPFQNRFYKLYFCKWRGATLELRRIAHDEAAATIIRVFRGHRARQTAHLMRRQLAELKAQAQKLLDFRIKYREHQAQKIQMVWRRFLRSQAIKSRQQRKESALYLQKLFRNRKLQRNQLVHTLLHVKKVQAAIIFQKLYRGHQVRKLLCLQSRNQKREALVAAILARNVSKEALLQWKMDRQGAAFLICSRALYPFAVKRRMQHLMFLARRQCAAQIIARRVCIWFGVSARREQAGSKQLAKWLQVLKIEQLRTKETAILIQKHLRRWVQQRKFQMETTRRKKLARRQRIADKEATKKLHKLKQQQRGNLDRTSLLIPTLSSSSSSSKPTVKKPGAPKFTSVLKTIGKHSQQHSQLPESETVETQAARKISRCYLRHAHHTKFLRAHWRAQACQVELSVLMRRKAAIAIQKRVRGVQTREVFKRLKAEKLLVSYIIKWKWKQIVKFVQAAHKIYRWIQHKRTQQFAQLWRLERRKQHLMATRIQKMVRIRLCFKRKLIFLLAKARKLDETQLFCVQSLRICAQHLTDELIFASLSCSFEESMKAFLFPSTGVHKNQIHHQRKPNSNSNGLVFPMMQMVFLVVSGAKDPLKWKDMDEKALLQTKLERSRVVALFKAVNRHFQDNHTKTSTKSSSSSPKAKSKTGSNAAFFSMTDVDLALAKAGGASKRALTFEEFAKVLRLLGEMKLTRVTIWWSKFDSSDAQLFSLLWDFLFVLPEFHSIVHQLDDFVTQVLNKHCERIQQLFQRGNNLKRGLLMRLQMRKQLELQAKVRTCTKLQARVRMFLAKKQLRARIQQVYEKYIDPEWGLPYWTNPKTGYSTWEKPRVLRAEDVGTEVVPYPPASLTLKIPCEGEQECAKCAEWFCYECEEFFCGMCLPTFCKDKGSKMEKSEGLECLEVNTGAFDNTSEDHSPNKKSHEIEKIALCGLCQFQVASRKCVSCLPKPGHSLKKKKSQLASMLASEDDKSALSLKDISSSSLEKEALFCDVCFAFTHRRGALQVHKSIELLEMCQTCSTEDDEDGDEELHKDESSSSSSTPNQSQPRHHHPSKKKCDPARAVQFECEHYETMNKAITKMRVCGKCAATSHPIELCGESVKKIPLQTLTMLKRARRIAEEIEARDRADVEKMKMRALQAKRERHATRIQKFWRTKVPILRAKHTVVQLKTEKLERWRRLKEDAKLEKQFVYLARNFFGLAKPLQTDTAVKKRLREMNALQRRQLTLRARMFGLLAHEYMRVGVPLPGVGRVLSGSSKEIVTSEDLRGWVKNRQTIRLKRINVLGPGTVKKEKALENLSSWFHLSHWDQSDAAVAAAAGTAGGDSFEEILVDVDPKEKLTERTIPLAQRVEFSDGDATSVTTAGGEAQEDGGPVVDEERVFVMYLVEYSMDPRRVVWINHSLAERFWAWRRQKNLDLKERQRLAREEKERKARTDADTGGTNTAAAAESTVASSKVGSLNAADAEQTPEEDDVKPATEQSVQPYADYYSYPPDQSLVGGTGAEAPEAAACGYDYTSSYNNAYEYGYDYNAYNYDYTSGTTATEAPTYPAADAPLVDSSGYFNAPDGNASVWQGYDYDVNAYNVSDPYYTSYNYANGEAEYAAQSADLYQSLGGYDGDANGNYYQDGAAWNGNAGYYTQYQQTTAESYATDQSYGYAPGNYDTAAVSSQSFADGYIDHHSQSPYPASQIPMDGGGDPGCGYGYSTELGTNGQLAAGAVASEYEANVNAQSAWEEVFDPQTSQVYYVNRVTQETAWELPPSYS